MRIACLQIEDVEKLQDLDRSSPQMLHVESCARCHSLYLSYREFLHDDRVPRGADPDAAAARWRMALGSRAPARRGGLMMRLLRLWPAPAWGIAAAVVIGIGLYAGIHAVGERDRGVVLRGTPAPATARDAIRIEGISRGSDSIEIRWSPVPGVERYEVRVLGSDLVKRRRFDAGTANALVIPLHELGGPAPPEEMIGLQVIGIRGGRQAAASPITAVRIPPPADRSIR